METGALAILQRHLRPGEKLIWSGRPDPWRLIGPLLPAIVVAVFWWALVVSVIVTVLQAADGSTTDVASPSRDGAIGLLLIVALFLGLGIVGALRLSHKIVSAWRVRYGLTDHRALIVVDLWPRHARSYDPGAFRRMERRGDDRVGTIAFGFPEHWRDRRRPFHTDEPRFAGISEPVRVEKLIREYFLKSLPPEGATS